MSSPICQVRGVLGSIFLWFYPSSDMVGLPTGSGSLELRELCSKASVASCLAKALLLGEASAANRCWALAALWALVVLYNVLFLVEKANALVLASPCRATDSRRVAPSSPLFHSSPLQVHTDTAVEMALLALQPWCGAGLTAGRVTHRLHQKGTVDLAVHLFHGWVCCSR